MSICLFTVATLISYTQYRYSYKLNYEDHETAEDYDDIDEEEDNTENETFSDEQDTIENKQNVNQTGVSEDKNIKSGKNTRDIIVKKNENIYSILCSHGIPNGDALKASSEISKIFKLKNIRAGLKITLTTNIDNNIVTLEKLEFKPNPKYKIIVSKNKSNFIAVKENVKLKKVVHNVSGVIHPKTVKQSLQKCNINKKIENETISVLKNVTNISSCKKQINFDLVYEKYYDEENNIVDNKFLYIAAVIDGRIKRIYKFNHEGTEEYIYSDGTIINSNKGVSMFIQPIVYKTISSPFGLRVHPITGRSKIHTGVDLRANIGTPVKASASGVVTKATYFSGYGNYINISHPGGLKTAYAHLSKILVRNGQYVKQGQVIAYSGNSGNSTGPHLHYELMKNGKYINPLSFVPKQPRQLTGKHLARFNNFKHSLNLKVAQLPSSSLKTIV